VVNLELTLSTSSKSLYGVLFFSKKIFDFLFKLNVDSSVLEYIDLLLKLLFKFEGILTLTAPSSIVDFKFFLNRSVVAILSILMFLLDVIIGVNILLFFNKRLEPSLKFK